MTTELSKQLANIRSRQIAADPIYKGKASLFLSPKEAAAIDTEEVYETAAKALDTLIQYDDRFSIFKEGLMHPSSISVQRELKTEEENKILDRDINSLLQLLSLFATETPSHAILEYLIRRYRIHELNADATIKCMLHLHDTKIFARMIQLVTLPDFWIFLNGVKKSGSPLPREAIVKRCQKETGLLSCICSIARTAITLASTSSLRSISTTSNGADRIISFVTVTILEMSDGKPLSDTQLREILSFLLEGLNLTYDNDENGSKNSIRGKPSEQWRRASCMIISQISRSTSMSQQLLSSIISSLTKSFLRISGNPLIGSNPLVEIITTLAVLSSYQEVNFGSDDIGRLFSDMISMNNSQFLHHIESIQQNFEISNLMNSLVSSITSMITPKDNKIKNSINYSTLCTILKSIFSKEMATPKCLQNCVVKILSYLCHLESKNDIDTNVDACKDYLRYVCQRFPQTFDSCISVLSDVDVLKDDNSHALIRGNIREVLRKVIENTFVDAPYVIPSDNFSSLLLSLNHNSPFIRIEALERFATTMPKGCESTLDVVGLADAACSCLYNDNIDVATTAWNVSVVSRVAEHVKPVQLFEAVELSLTLWHDKIKRHPEQSTSIITKIFEAIGDPTIYPKLCDNTVSEFKGMSGADCIFIMLIHFTFEEPKLVKDSAWKCAAMVGDTYPLLKGMKGSKGNKSSSYESNLAECLAKNMENSQCVKLLEKILLFVHETINAYDISQSFIMLIDRLLNILGQKGNESFSLILNVFTPIVLKRLKKIEMNNLDGTLDVLLSIFTLYSTTIGKKTKKDLKQQNMSKYINSIIGYLNASDIGCRILLSILNSNNKDVISLLGPCLSTFFSFDGGPSLVLLNIALSPDPRSETLGEFFITTEDEIPENYSNSKLVVTTRARAGAIRALSALIDSTTDIDKLSETNSLFIISSIPLLMASCSSASVSVRKAAVTLATSLHKLKRTTELTLNPAFLKTVNLNHNPTFAEINIFSGIIHDHSSTICIDMAATSSILSSAFKSKDQKSKFLQKTIMWLSTVLGWSGAHINISLFSVITSISLNDSWEYIQYLLNNITEGNSDAERLSSSIIQSLSSIKLADDSTQKKISDWIHTIIINEPTNKLQSFIQDKALELLSHGWCEHLTNVTVKNQIYEILMKELINRPGQKSLKEAIVAIHVDSSITISTLLNEVVQFKNLVSEINYNVDDNDKNWNIAGLSSNMQNLCSILEVTKPAISSSNYVEIMNNLLSSLLDIIPILSQQFFKAVFHIDYCIGSVIDFATMIAQKGGVSLVEDNSSKKSSKAQKGVYSKGRIQTDIENILRCLTQSRTVLVQRSSLQLLSSIASLAPESINTSIQALGGLLSKSAVIHDSELFMGKNGLMAEVLRSFVQISNSSNKNIDINAEAVILPFFSHFQSFLAPRREMLVDMLMEIIGFKALPICLTSILMHSIVAFDLSQSQMIPDNSDEISLILLSRSSARNAKRAMKNSQSDEFMTLACKTCLKYSPDIQISLLISLVKSSIELLFYATNILDDDDYDYDIASSLMKLNLESFLNHTEGLISTKFDNKAVDEKMNGIVIGQALLQLEFINDIIENKSFHILLAQVSNDDDENIQKLLVELSEHLLQLLSLSSKLHSSSALFKGNEETCEIYLGNNLMTIRPNNVGDTIHNGCLSIMKEMQKLLDAPTFVAILEELLTHKDIGVRQNAIQILTQRLEEMGTSRKPRREEKALLLDLVGNLRQTITDVEPFLKSYSIDASTHIGLAQSAMMCIDLLSRNLGKSTDWTETLVDTLAQLCDFAVQLSSQTDAMQDTKKRKRRDSKSENDLNSSLEFMKLLGSTYLCIGSLCGSVDAHALPLLSKIMGTMLGSLTKQGQYLISICNDDGFDESMESPSITKGRLLLVRSSITAITATISHLPNFIHTYIESILSGTLNLYRITIDPEASAVEDDIDCCLSRLASAVPPRLSIPAVFQAAPSLLGMGHTVGRRFSILLAEIWRSLDRPTVLAHITNLSGLATLLLDYRRVYGDQSEEMDTMNEVIIEAVLELCLKFTEVELKNFLARLSEWRDIDLGIEKDCWQKYSRTLIYFQLVTSLCSKLRTIFVPAMTPIWPVIADKLSEFSKILLYQPHRSSSSKKKRRKFAEDSASERSDESQAVVPVEAKYEISKTTEKILESIRLCCVYDNITDARYELVMPIVVSLLSVRISFESDETFLEYCEEYVIPTITALATSVNKDLLWKPLNRKVLMLLRDKKKAVRIAALKAIHGLFSKVGEEYLLLLPECLPFLSESLEDDALDVAALTQEVIKYIEELSGEKLENYLRI